MLDKFLEIGKRQIKYLFKTGSRSIVTQIDKFTIRTYTVHSYVLRIEIVHKGKGNVLELLTALSDVGKNNGKSKN